MPEGPWGRLRAVETDGVLGEVAAIGGHQALLARSVAQHFHHAGNGVHHVVVQRPAGEGQAAGHGQRQFPIQADFRRRHLHGDRKAAIQVHPVEIRRLPVGPFEGAAGCEADGRGTVQAVPVRHQIVVVCVGSGPRIDPLLARNAQGTRLALRTQEQCRALIDITVGIHELGVRE